MSKDKKKRYVPFGPEGEMVEVSAANVIGLIAFILVAAILCALLVPVKHNDGTVTPGLLFRRPVEGSATP